MLDTIKISVIMSVYKEPLSWLEESINSILCQTVSNLEFIIILDNPEYDEAKLLLQGYEASDKRVRLILNKQNIGLTKSLNIGLASAKGHYIARMDADDISLPDRFEKQINYMESNPAVSVCYTNYNRINSEGKIISHNYVNPRKSGREWLAWTNPIGHSTVMFRRKILKLRTPLYNEEFKRTQDYELWTYLSLNNCEFGFINMPLLLYRESDLQVTHFHKGNQDSNLYHIRHNYIMQYLIKNHYINNNVTGAKLVKCLDKLPVKKSFKNETDMILYLAYYTASADNFKYSLKFLFDRRLLVYKYGIRYSAYILLNNVIKHKWDTYLI